METGKKTKWLLAAEKIKSWIKQKKYPPGSKLPSILKLADMLGMTDQPIRKAVAQLCKDNVVYTKNGVGIFVTGPNENKRKFMLFTSRNPENNSTDKNFFTHWEIYAGIIDFLNRSKYEYHLVFNDIKMTFRQLFNVYKKEKCSGVITFGLNSPIIEQLAMKIGFFRIASADFSGENNKFSSMKADFQSGINAVLKKAYNLGHRRFALLYGHNINTNRSQLERFRCFVDFCRSHDIPVPPDNMIPTKGDAIDGYRAAKTLLQKKERPTLIFSVTDNRAKGVIEALKEAGLTPGREVSVIGFDDMPEIEKWDLCTVCVPRMEIGIQTVKMLDRAIAEQNNQLHEVIKTYPVYRKSLGPV